MSVLGRFIVVEGLEGAGKSTALKTINRFLTTQGIKTITTREPGGTSVGEILRELIKDTERAALLDPRAELLLMYASRVQLLEEVIRPALGQGTWVLADRFELSTWAYQGVGRKLNAEMIRHLSLFCLDKIKPDLILFLDISPEQGLKRASQRGKIDRIEQESLAFFKQVYAGYHQCIKTMDNVVVVDASLPLKTVQQHIISVLQTHLFDSA